MTDKKRLEEIKRNVSKQVYDRLIVPKTKVTIDYKDYKYLYEQAERVHELEQQNQRYREALEFYADENNYREQELKGIVPPRPITFKPILHDYGSIARKALEESE